jgi:hypothetical protein
MRNLCACVANRVTLLRPKGWGFSPRVSDLLEYTSIKEGFEFH